MEAVAGELFDDIGACLTAGDREGAIGGGAVGSNHGSPCAAGVAGEVAHLEDRTLNGCIGGDTIILPDADGAEGPVLEAEGVARTSGDECLLRIFVRQSETRRGFQLFDSEPAIPQRQTGEDDASVLTKNSLMVNAPVPERMAVRISKALWAK